ncbi:MAG: tetratricopeptide repeat protein [Hyphomicrobium sp.]
MFHLKNNKSTSKRLSISILVPLIMGLSLPSRAEKTETFNVTPSLSGSYLAGRFARTDNDTLNAAEFYENALTLDPTNDLLLEQTLLMQASQGSWNRAVPLSETLVIEEPKHRMARIILGLHAFKEGNFKRAEKEFNAAASGPIGEITSALSLAWTKIAQKDLTGALESLSVSTKADWAQFYLLYHRALICDVAGRSKEAKGSYEKLFQKDGRTLRTALAYARSLAHTGDFQAAKTKLTEFTSQSQFEGHALARSLMSELELRKKLPLLVSTPSEGLTEVFYGLGESLIGEGAIGVGVIYLQMALYITPGHPFSLAALANAYEANKQYKDAIEMYDRIPKGSPLETAIEIRKALNLNSLDKTDEARSVLEKLLSTVSSAEDETRGQPSPTSEPNLTLEQINVNFRGRILQNGAQGDDVRTVQTLLRNLGYDNDKTFDGNYTQNTENSVKKFQKDNNLFADGRVGKLTFEKLIKVAKLKENQINIPFSKTSQEKEAQNLKKKIGKIEELQILDALGNILRSRKLYAEAVSVYDRAIGLIPVPEQKHWIYFYARGTSYERIKKWTLAEIDLKKALELYPDQPLALNYLGYSWVDQGINLDQGMQLIERAVSLKPDDGYIVDSLGWAHFKRKNFKEAVRYLERAVELRPDDPVLNDHLGDALWQVGRQREAKFQWDQSLSLNPEPEDAAKTRTKIQEGLTLEETSPHTLADSDKFIAP